jgi:carbon-monoxide dehydrogenase medium subunit
MAELPQVQVLAGGTDLLVDVDSGLRQAENVVAINDISELKKIRLVDDKLSIGAVCRAAAVESDALVREHLPELAAMVLLFASPQIRNRATLAGNICSAVPCGDFPPMLMSLGAEIELCSSRGSRLLPLREYFVGNRETVRQSDEILTRILVPMKPERAAATYLKFRRRASNSLALVSVAAYLELSDDVCNQARIVLGSVAPIPLAATEAGASLEGKTIDDATITAAAEIASHESQPISDLRGSEQYRRQLVRVLTERAVRKTLTTINGGQQ